MDTPALTEAVTIAGGQSALARAISAYPGQVKQGHVWCWLNRDYKAPAEYCPAIEDATGVTCERLRPELDWIREAGEVTGYCIHFDADPNQHKDG